MAYILKIEDKEYRGDITKAGNLLNVSLDGNNFQVEIARMDKDHFTLIIDNKPYEIFFETQSQLTINGEVYSFEIIDEQLAKVLKAGPEATHKKEVIITAPMPGLVIEVEVNEGDIVKKGQGLLIIEAMKMQNEFKSPRDGTVKKIMVKKGSTVNSRDPLVVIE